MVSQAKVIQAVPEKKAPSVQFTSAKVTPGMTRITAKADFDSYPELEKHKDWYEHLKTYSYTNVDAFMEMEVTKKFVSVLENAGVYKMDDEGMDGFSRFVKTLW